MSPADTGLVDVPARLAAADAAALEALGLTGDDVGDALAAIAAVGADPAALAVVTGLADALAARAGVVPPSYDVLDPAAGAAQGWGSGVLALVALIATADDARAAHWARGVSSAVSVATLADLGQQMRVHRRTFDGFGLHTASWMAAVWSGALVRLGRLQFELADFGGERVLSVHIPEDGPLAPAEVDRSFAAADRFFAEHFPDEAFTRFHCGSWLLDPQLADALGSAANIVRFQRRWTLTDQVEDGDEDAVFFVFRRRGEGVDRAALPRDTTLQRAVLDRLAAGGHWRLVHGLQGREAALGAGPA